VPVIVAVPLSCCRLLEKGRRYQEKLQEAQRRQDEHPRDAATGQPLFRPKTHRAPQWERNPEGACMALARSLCVCVCVCARVCLCLFCCFVGAGCGLLGLRACLWGLCRWWRPGSILWPALLLELPLLSIPFQGSIEQLSVS
jgi:hypothetical protein